LTPCSYLSNKISL